MDNYETGIYTDNPDDTLRYMKSVEVVEVVRCKDCWRKNAGTKDKENVHCGMFNMWMDSDFFCKFGERRSE